MSIYHYSQPTSHHQFRDNTEKLSGSAVGVASAYSYPCKRCGKFHKIANGRRKNPDGHGWICLGCA